MAIADLAEARASWACSHLLSDRRRSALGDLVEPPSQVGPTEGQDYGVTGATALNYLLVGRIAVALHDAAITSEQRHRMLGAASRSVGIDDGRRPSAAAPGAVVACDRPEVPGLGASAARIEHR